MEKFEIKITKSLNADKHFFNCLDDILPQNPQENVVSFYFLALKLGEDKPRFGKSLNETKAINNQNNQIILSCYKKLKKALKHFKRKNVSVDKTIYCVGECVNDNYEVLECILNAGLIKSRKEREEYVYLASCDIIQNCYTANNFCDFKEGKCKNRQVNETAPKFNPSSCCSSNCKNMGSKGCVTKNLSCKFFFCKYLIENGVYMSPKTFLPTKMYFSRWQQNFVKDDFFIDTKSALKRLHYARFFAPFIFKKY